MTSCDNIENYQLCTNKHDPFIDDKTIWIVTLDNGVKIYQDDGRRGVVIHSAWIRLGNYIRESNRQIVNLDLKFGTHTVPVFGSKNAYYFSKGAGGTMGVKETTYFYILGSVQDFTQETFQCQYYIVPALEIIRTINKETNQATSPQLIRNNV